jgi:CheY-like chemotaxis protein
MQSTPSPVRIAIIDDEEQHLRELVRLVEGYEHFWESLGIPSPTIRPYGVSEVNDLIADIQRGPLRFDIIISDIFLGPSKYDGVSIYRALKPYASKKEFLLILVTQRPGDDARRIGSEIEREQDGEEIPWAKVWRKPAGFLKGSEVSAGAWAQTMRYAIRQFRDLAWRKTWIPSALKSELFTVLPETTTFTVGAVASWLQSQPSRTFPSFVIAIGDSGTGVELVARLLHGTEDGLYRESLLGTPPAEFDALIFGDAAETSEPAASSYLARAHGGTLLLAEFANRNTCDSEQLRNRFVRLAESGKYTSKGMLTSFAGTIIIGIATAWRDDFLHKWSDFIGLRQVCPQLITLPRLRDHPHWVSRIAQEWIERKTEGDMCFTPGSIDFLRQCQWPNNFVSLNHFLQEIITQQITGEIPADLVAECLGLPALTEGWKEAAERIKQAVALDENKKTLSRIAWSIYGDGGPYPGSDKPHCKVARRRLDAAIEEICARAAEQGTGEGTEIRELLDPLLGKGRKAGSHRDVFDVGSAGRVSRPR